MTRIDRSQKSSPPRRVGVRNSGVRRNGTADAIIPGLSVCIITLNEEGRLLRSLESVEFADEVVVLDSGSVDSTVAIAKGKNARVEVRPFDDFVNQKNQAIRLATREWILVLDADEVVTPELRDEIHKIVSGEDPRSRTMEGFRIPRMSYYMGQWIRHSGWFPDYNVRLFRNGSARFEGGTVHERARVNGPVGVLKGHLEHYSYQNISGHLIRIDQYSTLIAQDKFRRGEKATIVWSLGKGMMKIFLTYFYNLGFLDGRAGIVIAMMGGYYNFLKYVKLWELWHGLRSLPEYNDPIAGGSRQPNPEANSRANPDKGIKRKAVRKKS